MTGEQANDKPCPVCSTAMQPVGRPALAEEPGRDHMAFAKCPRCGLMVRLDVRAGERPDHYDQAGYVHADYEQSFLHAKQLMFQDLVHRAERCLPGGKRRTFLDVGCSYGHLGLMFKEAGWNVIGVDVAKSIREHHRRMGTFPVYESIDDPAIPDGGVDAVALIDVLYYLPDPLTSMQCIWRKLSTPGVVFIRTAHRTQYLKLAKLLPGIFGPAKLKSLAFDHVTFWNEKSAKALARRAGFDACRIRYREKGYRYTTWTRTMAHRTTQWIAALTGGLIGLSTVLHLELWKGQPRSGKDPS